MKLAASLAGADGLAARLAGRLDGRAIEESLVAELLAATFGSPGEVAANPR